MQLSLLCWNIQKRSLTPTFRHVFERLLEHHSCDLIALQEIRLPHGHMPIHFQHFSHALSCNIMRDSHCFGVMTLSRLPLLASHSYLSKAKEVGVATRKSAVLTQHRLPDGRTLSLLNLHVINFVPYALFAKELHRIGTFLSKAEQDHLIIAGDFNTWNPKRQTRLQAMMEEFGLEKVVPDNEKKIKSILGEPLDHIYCRGMDVKHALVIDTPVSDHNPIVATFTV
ncbi:endonuclease/exonuclease/phosphatase family protein [Hydrogenimonas sp.]|uniref:endonuclease/exonuclease/phosphatase family protein n=1 Tax=Hydrogenimonas sp. TaxID=2231112 RepID=UPI002623C1F0|nr:endonuclease/exonuclease/phosphatase family protein [Hydrogenimonas sp.]